MAGPDRPSPAGRDAVPSLSRRKRGRPGRWTSQLLLLRPRPSAWPVTSSNKLRPAAFGVTAPSPGPRALPFPPIRSGISAPPPSWPMGILSWPPSRRLSDRKPSWPAPTGHLSPCCRHGRPRPAISSARPLFSALFAGSAVVFVRRPIIFGPFLSAWRSISSIGPSYSAIIVGMVDSK